MADGSGPAGDGEREAATTASPRAEAGGHHAADVSEEIAAPWWKSILAEVGPLDMFDAHTHIGSNDPDGFRQSTEQLLAGLRRLDGRAVVFPMHEPDGYPPANDAVLAAAADSGGRLVPFCRVDPHTDAAAEARRCLDAGARGIKLHPRAERFRLAEPAVRELFALADARRLPVLIHAGRGIPALGRDTVELAGEFPGARPILAHAAVSDLAWLWRVVGEHPNLFIDTSWWLPGDMIALFSYVPGGQILWGSDSPYASPLKSAVETARFALQAGVEPETLRLIAGSQLERLLAGEEPLPTPPPRGESGSLDPLLERLVQYLMGAVGSCTAGGDPTELVSLARLACAVDHGPHAELCAAVLELLDIADEHLPQADDVRWGTGARLLSAALTVARTPDVPLPPRPGAPAPTRESAESAPAS